MTWDRLAFWRAMFGRPVVVTDRELRWAEDCEANAREADRLIADLDAAGPVADRMTQATVDALTKWCQEVAARERARALWLRSGGREGMP